MSITTREPRSAFIELSKTSSRELFRNIKVVLSLLTLFVFFLLLNIGMNAMVNSGPEPVVGVVEGSDHEDALIQQLINRGIEAEKVAETTEPTAGSHTAIVHITGERAVIGLPTGEAPAWIELAAVVQGLGIPSADITVIDTSGFESIDFLRQNLGLVLVMGFLGLALIGTAVPLATMRKNGTLRLFGTTPVKRLTFLLAQVPVQFALGVLQCAIVIGIAFVSGYIESLIAIRLLVTLLLGLSMLFSFGYLLAARSSNPEILQQLTGVLPIFIIFLSGTVIPLQALPEFVQQIPKILPTTWLMQAINADIVGAEPFLNVYALWGMMAAVTLAMAIIGSRVFRWDQGDL